MVVVVVVTLVLIVYVPVVVVPLQAITSQGQVKRCLGWWMNPRSSGWLGYADSALGILMGSMLRHACFAAYKNS